MHVYVCIGCICRYTEIPKSLKFPLFENSLPTFLSGTREIGTSYFAIRDPRKVKCKMFAFNIYFYFVFFFYCIFDAINSPWTINHYTRLDFARKISSICFARLLLTHIANFSTGSSAQKCIHLGHVTFQRVTFLKLFSILSSYLFKDLRFSKTFKHFSSNNFLLIKLYILLFFSFFFF